MKNAKLTAALVTEAAKQTIVDLRNEFDLTEKQLVDLILKQALRRKSELSKLVEKLHADLDLEKEAKLTARVAQYKAKAAAARKVKSAEKLKAKLSKLENEAEPVKVESAE
jgi:replication initiation and membrane attachment protein DnaB